MILFRAFLREVLTALAGVLGVLILVFLCQDFIRYLALAVEGQFPSSVLFRLVMFEIPVLASLLLPIGLYISLLLVYGRWNTDAEMIVLRASGVSRWQLLQLNLALSLGVAMLVSSLVFEINPILAGKRRAFIDQAKQTAAFQMISPGRFQKTPNGRAIFYAQAVRKDHLLQDLFIAESAEPSKPQVVLFAETGRYRIDAQSGNVFVEARNGYRYEGTPGEPDCQVTHFGTYTLKIASLPVVRSQPPLKARSTLALWQHRLDRRDRAELEWRLAIPISMLILSMTAIPLSEMRPRQGRFQKLFSALLLGLFYLTLLFVGRSGLEGGGVPLIFGLWWVHVLALLIAGELWRRGSCD